MKKVFLLGWILAASIAGLAQAEWKELDAFHLVMAQTFHPAQEGKYEPIRDRAGEMARLAKTLKKSKIPAGYQKPELKKLLALLARESASLQKQIASGASDEAVFTSLDALHDRFHQIAEACPH